MSRSAITLTGTLLLILVGCATSSFSYGRNFPIENARLLKKGAPKPEVLQLFGEPFTKTMMSDGVEMWNYSFFTNTATAQSFLVATQVQSTGTRKNLSVQFKDDTVSQFSYSEGQNPGVGSTTVLP